MKFYLPIFLTIIAANPCMLPGSTGQLIFGFFRRISPHLYFRRKTLGARFTQGFLFRRRSVDLFPDAVDVVERGIIPGSIL